MPSRDFKPESSRKTHIFWRFSLALCATVLLLMVSTASVRAAWEMYQTFDVAASGRTGSEAELAALKQEYSDMAATLEAFNSNRGYEAAMRERFGVVKPGEGEIRIVRVKEESGVQEGSQDNPFTRLFDALFQW